MNKKFSTLAVAAMLASAFTVNAAPGEAVKKMTTGNNEKLYQLVISPADGSAVDFQNNPLVLEMTKDRDLQVVNRDAATLGQSLWCVNIVRENLGKNSIFDFTNKSTEMMLDITVGGWNQSGTGWTKVAATGTTPEYWYKTAEVGGEVSGWEFAPSLNPLTQENYMASYIDETRVAVLIWNATNDDIDVAVVKADEVEKLGNKLVKFTIAEADHLNLTSNDFNTILQTRTDEDVVKLTFDKDYNNTEIVNPFSTNELKAEPTGDNGFVYLYKTEANGKKSYLRVDTAYVNGYGTKFLGFAFKEANAANTLQEDIANLKEQYKFRLHYHPTGDSLFIQAKSVIYKVNDNKEWWSKGLTGTAATNEFYTVGWQDEVDVDGTPSTGTATTGGNRNWVKLQDLESATESRIVTVGDMPINTRVSFGYGECVNVGAGMTSVADGVYYIVDKDGKYLASPIYENGEQAAHFVTVNADEQNPAHMPAYQWVVLTKYTQADSKPTSPVIITNREFANLDAEMQLFKNEGAQYMYLKSAQNGDVIIPADSVKFVAVPQSSVEDPYLGYKKLTKEELTVNKYTFNYWHPYADDKYIAQSSKDSTLTVMEGKNAFRIDTVANKYMGYDYNTVDIAYGYDPSNAKLNNKERIAGLAQLVRTVYVMSKDGAAWRINTENKFNVSKYADAQQNVMINSSLPTSIEQTVPTFFLKENNQINGKCYHALVAADLQLNGPDAYTYEILDKDATLKAGVSDYDAAATLKKQLLNETRTSAFYIAPDETPLYRRFNSALLEGQEGDGVDTLRFYEKYRNEYLMIEANKNFMVEHIDFLGIDAQDKAQGGLAFIVDTAWVNRGFGNIKPQYLISIDRHDYQGVAGEPCTEAGPHIDESGHITDDPYECVHAHKAVPGFKRGKFLINFHNFANNEVMVNADDYKWANYDRAGFKEAIVYNDTLYVLRDEFKNLKNEEIDLAKIASAEVEAQKAYSKEHGDLNGFLSYKYELAGDQHKYVTWSMRFVDRSVAANEVEADRAFLVESMGHDADIAPVYAAWLKMQNGCLVLSDYNSQFDEVVTGGDDALIFNVEHVDGDQVAVDNENIAVEGVSVVAGNGQVTIMGAAGKNVTITNILGKVIANQTIASDNATIAVPAGIVAVAVEGEAAVKAIVK
ncbi:MAG TPA: hypothetical protein H9977_03110 [Candidatus Parabacteroides intestinipullorum]|uniref:DUF6383 domain-containing protein n=1 Tax=Candidatus Parabacteroides intestinipullorum TaxID=2838723 RepID=A0A9D1X7M2_9BACT|nr:hypothetical protein [Candidatus Parabacteroides intestinipullorum]